MASLALTPDIKVITGVRRSGKSKLMEAFSERLKQADPGANIIHINFNLTEHESLLEYHTLEQYIEARYQAEKSNYVLIDEVQMCPSFEKAINSLHAKEKP
ncbi:MAG: AAA family ATPase [Clostridia bacterium]|nr:AAA family ATPase [Clostridia bacterium]